jgi:hypothetical protein
LKQLNRRKWSTDSNPTTVYYIYIYMVTFLRQL